MEVLLVEVESGADHQELLTVLHLVPPLKVLPSILLSSELLIAADWPKEREQAEAEHHLNVKMH